MPDEYVFRGETEPFRPDPEDLRKREKAKQEAEQLLHRKPPTPDENLAADADVEDGVGDYQVGGIDSFGTESSSPNQTLSESRSDH